MTQFMRRFVYNNILVSCWDKDALIRDCFIKGKKKQNSQSRPFGNQSKHLYKLLFVCLSCFILRMNQTQSVGVVLTVAVNGSFISC